MAKRLFAILLLIIPLISCNDTVNGLLTNAIPNEYKNGEDTGAAQTPQAPQVPQLPPMTFSLDNSIIEVSAATVPSGSSISIKLTVKDESGNAVPYKGLDVTFYYFGGTSTGSIGNISDNNDGTYSAHFTGILVGTPIVLGGTINSENLLSTLPEVTVTTGSASALTIEDAADGTGHIITTATLADAQTKTFYAISRDVNGNFVANESVTWSDSNNFGAFSSTIGTFSTFYPSPVEGNTVVSAVHTTLGAANTGNIAVTWTGLVGSWRLNNNFLDESGELNDGTNAGATFAAGIKAEAGSYANTAYTIMSSTPALELTSRGSVSAWINMNSYVVSGGIVHKGELASFNDEQYSLQLWDSNKVFFGLDYAPPSGYSYVLSKTQVFPATWYHLVGTWDSTGVYIYINGALDNTTLTTSTSAAVSAGRVLIGSQLVEFYDGNYKNFPFDGIIDEVTIWNKTLTADEVQYLYNNGNAR
jgi:hypothetical protein